MKYKKQIGKLKKLCIDRKMFREMLDNIDISINAKAVKDVDDEIAALMLAISLMENIR